ncbi:DUF1295 domain-containing protein [filamentous cyanobacterium LEGE 11480]|uniref:DUF1295 domain-containing protein n=1 Tax=Romeriopsis navalis LEGE 11480 TaxID=2777977 RepID=A0A928VR50_9CYAN|nr:DUF1295 domain-containing protein [Romeriopsis navalis]MBE9030614.1 DUF1295 domain-containing protein [Romeriopsis navalis LEGE 11480]
MEPTTETAKTPVTQLTAINLAKVLTILCLLGFALVYGIHDHRQTLYLCLHVSYCLWWLLEQWLFPQRRQQVFTEPADIPSFVGILGFVGIFYALPGYFAFTNPQPIADLTIAIALPLYIFGSLINTSADIQKMTAKDMGAKLVQDGIWRSVRHINYLGDLMRYTSFSIIAGSLWAFLLPMMIVGLYFQRIIEKEKSMATKYRDFANYQAQSTRLLPWIW